MPHHCCNTAITTPMSRILRIEGWSNCRNPPSTVFSREAASMAASSSRACASPPIFVKILNAFSLYPDEANQRGLSGNTKLKKKNSAAGTVMAQNIHRHPVCPFHDRRIISAVAWSATGSAICQLTICALRIPSTTVNWLMDTKRPRKWAGAISAIYIGERLEAMPMANPPMRRNTLNHPKEFAAPVPMAVQINSPAATIRIGLRPNRSLNFPALNAPMRQPINALLMAQPCIVGLFAIWKYCS